MQMIQDGMCCPLRDAIASASENSSPVNIIAIVIDNRKLEVLQQNTKQEKERLVIYIADHTCQLFKVSCWGQVAVRSCSKLCPGNIILIDRLIIKSRDTDFFEGVFGVETTMHVLFNKFGLSFQKDNFPVMFNSVRDLLQFSQSYYKLFYIPFGHENEGLKVVEGENIATVTLPRSFESAVPSVMTSNNSLAASKSCPIKLLEDSREIQSDQRVSLRISKDVKIKLEDVVSVGIKNIAQWESKSFWTPNTVSKRWKVMDPRTNTGIFLCFESKAAAVNHARSIFASTDHSMGLRGSDHHAFSFLIQVTNLLIFRGAGRSLKECHSGLVVGSYPASHIQELLVTEESIFTHVSATCHKKRTLNQVQNIATDNKEVTLDRCRFMGMLLSMRDSSDECSISYHCSDLKCDRFLWQLLDLSSLDNTPELKRKYVEHILKLEVDNSSMSKFLGGVPASLLLEALLRCRSLTECCSACMPFLREFRQCYKFDNEDDGTSSKFSETDRGKSLNCIVNCVRRLLASVLSLPLVVLCSLNANHKCNTHDNNNMSDDFSISRFDIRDMINFDQRRGHKSFSNHNFYMCGSGSLQSVRASLNMPEMIHMSALQMASVSKRGKLRFLSFV